MAGPFSGVRIIDMSAVLMGPMCTEQFADLGADVIKIEPAGGDVVRAIGPSRHPGMTALFMNLNRNKRSLVLDLKANEGREVLLRLLGNADAFVYNLRPKSMARLGLTYEDVKAVNEHIVYLGAYGFSQSGPYAAKPAYDDLIQGAVGIPYLSQRGTGTPAYAPFALADYACGMYAAFCLSSALFHRKATGQGQSVEVPMFESMAAMVLGQHMWGKGFEPAIGEAGFLRHISPARRPLATQDGHICMLLVSDDQWRRFFVSQGMAQVLDDPKFASVNSRNANITELYELLAAQLTAKTTAEWMELFERIDVAATPMKTLDELMEDPHLRSTGFFQTVDHPTEGKIVGMRVPGRWSQSATEEWRSPAPTVGEHTEQILQEAGYADAEIQALKARGIAG